MINMKIENLKEGMVIKNYKELCELLELKPTTGRGKQNQLLLLNTWCDYHKQGNKFIIDNIFKEQKLPEISLQEVVKSRNNKYIKPLANIIIEYLYNNPKDVRNVPLSRLFTMLGITNTNYIDCNYYRKELSQLYDIRLASIYYFYSNTRLEFKNIIERCLNNLQSRRVLNWRKTIMIRDSKTGQLYQADEDTEKMIITSEKEALNHMQLDNMYQVISNKSLLKEFNKIVYAETGELDYFYTYNLIIGSQALRIEYINVMKEKQMLNELILGRTKDIFNKEKYNYYIEDYNKLNDILIDIANKEFIKDKLIEKHKENIDNYKTEKNKLDKEYEESKEEIKNKYIDIYDK